MIGVRDRAAPGRRRWPRRDRRGIDGAEADLDPATKVSVPFTSFSVTASGPGSWSGFRVTGKRDWRRRVLAGKEGAPRPARTSWPAPPSAPARLAETPESPPRSGTGLPPGACCTSPPGRHPTVLRRRARRPVRDRAQSCVDHRDRRGQAGRELGGRGAGIQRRLVGALRDVARDSSSTQVTVTVAVVDDAFKRNALCGFPSGALVARQAAAPSTTPARSHASGARRRVGRARAATEG